MRALGAAEIAAAVGPCIGPPSYEVAGDLVEALGEPGAPFLAPGARGGRWLFNLAGFCEARLRAVGVACAALGRDTLAEDALFFSHRRRTLAGGGPLGHQLSAIGLPA